MTTPNDPQGGLTRRRARQTAVSELQQEIRAGNDNTQGSRTQDKESAPLRPAETLQQFKERHQERIEEEQRQRERERGRPGYEMGM